MNAAYRAGVTWWTAEIKCFQLLKHTPQNKIRNKYECTVDQELGERSCFMFKDGVEWNFFSGLTYTFKQKIVEASILATQN